MTKAQTFGCWLAWLLLGAPILAQNPAPSSAELLTKENIVESARPDTAWFPANVGQQFLVGDRLRTGILSRATVRLTDLSVLRLNELTMLRILPPTESSKPGLDLKGGAIYFFSRDKPQDMHIRTPIATGALRGTEFNLSVAANGTTTLSMFDGEVELGNSLGTIVVRNGEQARVEPGKAPYKTAVIEAQNIIQWCLYYPGVIDPAELGLSRGEERALADSLAAYRAGDLLTALQAYPNDRNTSVAGAVYRATLFLGVGQVEKATAALAALPRNSPKKETILQLIAAVKFQEFQRTTPPQSASDWMAESYYRQSRSNLEGALQAALKATELAHGFGFAWARAAEMEFSFGRTAQAREFIQKALGLSPLNAQAHALHGFLLSAENRIDLARASFNQAIKVDGALSNAWLGRGLTLIRQGHDEEGRRDLQTAAVLEPNRSILRSYLGKAFSQVGLATKANLELTRAKGLDPNDPTPWLYSAIERKEENRYNEAIDEMEKSVALNNNRRVYRSSLLLDQDRAVRGANLAAIYRDTGLVEQSVREATLAVESDYSSAGAHLFLADSFDALRDPRRVLLRYETAWSNELLLSQLLSPVGAGSLSQFVSQQEYSKLFQEDGIGASSITDYRGDGQLLERSSVFGTSGNLSYAVDGEYYHRDSTGLNDHISRGDVTGTFKLQVTPQDTAFLLINFGWMESGFPFQTYDPDALKTRDVQVFDPMGNLTTEQRPNRAVLDYHLHEEETPGVVLLGWHHEWSPGNNTLVLVGRLSSRQTLRDNELPYTIYQRDVTNLVPQNLVDLSGAPDSLPVFRPYAGHGAIVSEFLDFLDLRYHSDFEAWSGELQHILKLGPDTIVAGGRWQSGQFDTGSHFSNLGGATGSPFTPYFDQGAAQQEFSVDGERESIYLYNYLQPLPWITLTTGLAYDWLRYPDNFRSPPVNGRQRSTEQFSPKVGLTLQPWTGTVLRGMWARSLSGATFDESVRLEPTEIAGFPQAYRSVISESLLGEMAGSKLTVRGVSLEQKLPSRTFLGGSYAIITQNNDRSVGTFDILSAFDLPLAIEPGTVLEQDRYREEVLTFTANQLFGDRWSLGIRYRLTHSELRQERPEVVTEIQSLADRGALDAALLDAHRHSEANLHEASLFAVYNHPSGFFGRAEANWYRQDNDDFVTSSIPPTDPAGQFGFVTNNQGLPGDDFWQLNLSAGYRFYRGRCEISAGILNITDSNYHLNPLNPYFDLPRERTWFVRCKLQF